MENLKLHRKAARVHPTGKSSPKSLFLNVFCAAILTLATTAFARADNPSKQTARDLEFSYRQAESDTATFNPINGLSAYLKYAALHNPGLRASFYRWKANMEAAGVVGGLPDPMFTYGYFIEPVETRVGPQQQKFGLRQSFPWFGTLGAKADAASAAADASYQEFVSKKLDLFYRVRSAYYDYYLLGREIEVTKENFELLKFWESVVRTKYKVGLSQHPDLIKAQVELGKIEDQLKTLQEKVRPAAARLRAVVNISDTVELPIPEDIPTIETELNRDSVLTEVISLNPDLKAAAMTIQKERASVSAANKAAYPSFTLGVDYIETGEALNPSMAESGKDPWMVSVGITLPIWFGKNSARREQARARLHMAQQSLEEKQNQLRAFTEQILFQYDDARRKISLYRDGLVPKAEQSLKASFTAYRAGEIDFLNLLDTQRQLLDFQLTLDRARTGAATRKAEIELLTGHEITP
jgi:outer membrane protein TolC